MPDADRQQNDDEAVSEREINSVHPARAQARQSVNGGEMIRVNRVAHPQSKTDD
jgi:hypothetical protein